MGSELIFKGSPLQYEDGLLLCNLDLADSFTSSEVELFWGGVGLSTAQDGNGIFALEVILSADPDDVEAPDDFVFGNVYLKKYINKTVNIFGCRFTNTASLYNSFIFNGINFAKSSENIILFKNSNLSLSDINLTTLASVNGNYFLIGQFNGKNYLVVRDLINTSILFQPCT